MPYPTAVETESDAYATHERRARPAWYHTPHDVDLAPGRDEASIRRRPSHQDRLAERLQTLLDVLPAGVLVLDGHGRIHECNPAAEELLGQPLSGQLWRDVIARAFRFQADGEELILANGRYVTLSTCPLGKEPGQILLLNDVTETRRLRERLERHRRLADMGRMAANLAHQIRTPLSSALLYTSQLKQPGLSDERRARCAEKAVGSLKGLERLINDMLLYARGGRGETQPLAPAALLRSAVAALADDLTVRGIGCRVSDETAGLMVSGNPVLLESAVKNLVSNAIEALEQGGNIDLIARAVPPGAVELVVRDDGPGVPRELQQSIFEPFTTTRGKGTGLGLAVVRTIARAHHGEVWLQSEPGRGSTFAIRLPAQQAADQSAVAA